MIYLTENYRRHSPEISLISKSPKKKINRILKEKSSLTDDRIVRKKSVIKKLNPYNY